MKSSSTIDLYRKHYSDIRFERVGLFKVIQGNYHCNEALYPGSFIHITPSFFFPHVVYVDQSPSAIEFFADALGVLQYINRNKKYKRSPYVRFIAQDYSTALPLREGQFDLLISLYASGISRSCKKYLKIGGILVTNNFQNDAREAAIDSEFQLISIVRNRKKSYTLVEDTPKDILVCQGEARTKRYTKQTSSGIEYTEIEDYFIFRRRGADAACRRTPYICGNEQQEKPYDLCAPLYT